MIGLVAEAPDRSGQLIAFAALALIVFVPTFTIWIKRAAPRRLAGIVQQVGDAASPGDRCVHMRFHAYHGFLVFFTQTPVDVAMPAASARLLLKRLLKFNLTWGFFAAGAVFIPVLSLLEYRAQMRSIERQEKGAFPVEPGS